MATDDSAESIPAMDWSQVKAVLWDVDGTLVDSTDLAWTSTNKVLEKNGFDTVSMAEYKEATRLTTPARLAFHAKKDEKDPVGDTLAEQFDGLYVGLVSPSTVPFFTGVDSLLGELHAEGVPVGALSNACGAYVRAVLSTHGLSEQFCCQLGADDVSEAKPAPGGLLQCCKDMGLEPGKACIYVGDSPGDGKAAKAAGLYGIGVRWGAGSEDALLAAFDEVVSTPDELRTSLLRAVRSCQT